MLVDLISVTTSDGITLDGAFFPAAEDASQPVHYQDPHPPLSTGVPIFAPDSTDAKKGNLIFRLNGRWVQPESLGYEPIRVLAPPFYSIIWVLLVSWYSGDSVVEMW